MSWEDAREQCQDHNLDLVSIANEAENALVMLAAENTNVWIGARDVLQDGQWKWADGTGFEYSAWNPGEPNDAGSGEDFLEFLGADGKWNDLPGTYVVDGYMCMGYEPFCGLGMYQESSSGQCRFCPVGTYSDTPGGTCKICPEGHWVSVVGAAKCQPCEAGTYNGDRGLDAAMHSSAASCAGCPDGLYSVGGAAQCVAGARYGVGSSFFVQEEKTYLDARSHCLAMGLDLASIRVAEENDVLAEVSNNVDAMWIGLYDVSDGGGDWQWSDG